MKETMSKTRQIDKIQYAKTLILSLQRVRFYITEQLFLTSQLLVQCTVPFSTCVKCLFGLCIIFKLYYDSYSHNLWTANVARTTTFFREQACADVRRDSLLQRNCWFAVFSLHCLV